MSTNTPIQEMIFEKEMYEKIHKKISQEFSGDESINRSKKKLLFFEENLSIIQNTISNLKTIYDKEVDHYYFFDSSDNLEYDEIEEKKQETNDTYNFILENLEDKEKNILKEIKILKDKIKVETENKVILDFLSNKIK